MATCNYLLYVVHRTDCSDWGPRQYNILPTYLPQCARVYCPVIASLEIFRQLVRDSKGRQSEMSTWARHRIIKCKFSARKNLFVLICYRCVGFLLAQILVSRFFGPTHLLPSMFSTTSPALDLFWENQVISYHDNLFIISLIFYHKLSKYTFLTFQLPSSSPISSSLDWSLIGPQRFWLVATGLLCIILFFVNWKQIAWTGFELNISKLWFWLCDTTAAMALCAKGTLLQVTTDKFKYKVK